MRHVRAAPLRNAFTYRTYQWLVDLDALPRLPWWLRPLASFRPPTISAAPGRSIRENVDRFLAARGIDLGGGRITMLANARVLGYVFNPLTVYWCHDAAGALRCVLAEVHNTYGQRHCYLLRTDERGRAEVAKEFYVSPFNPVDGRYRMSLPEPGDRLALTVALHRPAGPPFVASVRGAAGGHPGGRCPWPPGTRGRRRPSTGRIHAQGLKLYARGLPVSRGPAPPAGGSPVSQLTVNRPRGQHRPGPAAGRPAGPARPGAEARVTRPLAGRRAGRARAAGRRGRTMIAARRGGPRGRLLAARRRAAARGRAPARGPQARDHRHASRHAGQGASAGRTPTMYLWRPADFFRRVGAAGLIGFGESYMAGDWDSDDLPGLLTSMAGHMDRLVPRWLQWLRAALRRAPAAGGRRPRGARRNVHQHYDLSNDMFALFLDETMTYSAALFERAAAAATGVPRRTRWQRPSAGRSTGSSTSPASARAAGSWRSGRAGRAGHPRGRRAPGAVHHRVSRAAVPRPASHRRGRAGRPGGVELRDYREVTGQFDAIVSVEMAEAVAERYWPEYFATLDRLLAPGGRIGLQSITMAHDRMLATRRTQTWILKYIFPGGLIPR